MSLGLLFMGIIILLVIIGVAGICFLVSDRQKLNAWQDKVRRWTYRSRKPACRMEDGKLSWRFNRNHPRPLLHLAGLIIWGGLAYLILLTPDSYAYLLRYRSWRELEGDVWFLIVLFSSVWILLFGSMLLGLFRDYAIGIILDENAFIIQYKSGREKALSYRDIPVTEFKLWTTGVRGSLSFLPTFYFYDAGKRLVCGAEVRDKESYLLLFQTLNRHGLHYIEPPETMETYDCPPALGYKKGRG